MTAHDLLLDFISWGYKTPKPLRAGTRRRLEREGRGSHARGALYFATPTHPESRQVRRYREARA